MENEGFQRLNNIGEFKPSAEILEKAMSWLPREQQVCLRLFYFKEKNYREIADKTNFTLKQVKSNLQNGKRNLKIIIMEEYDRLRDE